MPLILPANTLLPSGYNIANSCRFNEPDAPSMSRGSISATNRRTWTFSYWIKRVQTTVRNSAHVGTMNHWNQGANDGSSDTVALFWGAGEGDYLQTWEYASDALIYIFNTKRAFRDFSAWYHIVLACDTTQGTDTNRFKIYINGTLLVAADFSTATYPAENVETLVNSTNDMRIGKQYNNRYIDGYLAEFAFIDGTQYAASDFGEFDEDSPTIWKPKDLDGLTFGTNGFWLDFEDSSALGNDVSGNNNDFTPSNLAAADQASDSPTNNFCTVNFSDNYYAGATITEGNCKVATGASNQTFNLGTIGLSTGKWFWEAYLTTAGGEEAIGIGALASTGTSDYGGKTAFSYSFKGNNGDIRNNDSNSDYGDAYAQDVVIGVALNLDDNEIKFYKDGTVENSGTAHSITAAASTPTGLYFPMFGDVDSDSVVWSVNFGGSPAVAPSSGNADGDGYGNFEYTVPSGFYSICTKNLATYG